MTDTQPITFSEARAFLLRVLIAHFLSTGASSGHAARSAAAFLTAYDTTVIKHVKTTLQPRSE